MFGGAASWNGRVYGLHNGIVQSVNNNNKIIRNLILTKSKLK
jgi:hypothetical protein